MALFASLIIVEDRLWNLAIVAAHLIFRTTARLEHQRLIRARDRRQLDKQEAA